MLRDSRARAPAGRNNVASLPIQALAEVAHTQTYPQRDSHTPVNAGFPEASGPGGAPSGAQKGVKPAPGDPQTDVVEAIKLIGTLPLSPAEKAEAIRLILASRQGG